MDYTIRRTEFEIIEHFTKKAGRERVIIRNEAGAVWFAAFITNRSDPIPIGSACCVINGQAALFRGIYVEKPYRRRGIFRALLKEQLKYCQAHDIKELTANCTPQSLPEFLAQGFTRAGNYKNSKTITIVRRVL